MVPALHPIDAAIRKHLRSLAPQQTELARRIGRSQGWLNKYLHGVGKPTIDDLVRMVAIVVLGVERPPALTADKRKLLRDWRALGPSRRTDAKRYLAVLARDANRNHGTANRSSGSR